MEKYYLVDETGAEVFSGSESEMFRLLSLEPSDTEAPLYGPIRQAEGGGWLLHPEGIRAPGMTIETE